MRPTDCQPSAFSLILVPMRRMGTQCEMRRIYTAMWNQSADLF
jgi:hypothetical protein